MIARSLGKVYMAVFCAVGLSIFPAAIGAQTVGSTSTISGTVVDSNGAPVAQALVTIAGPDRASTRSDQKGAFSLQGIKPGDYTVYIQKAGFQAASNDVVVLAGASASLDVQLAPASFSPVKEIGRVSTNGRSSINTSTASISSTSGDTFTTQGQLSITRILSETPGVTTPIDSSGNGATFNAAAPFANPSYPQVRGGLPYETLSLLDGHPLASTVSGGYSNAFLSPYLLQGIDVVKGPGATGLDINSAVNGTVNYRTLEPTKKMVISADLGLDNWGGQQSNYRLTGTLPGDRLSYAFDYAINGSPGPFQNLPTYTYNFPTFYPGGVLINGQKLSPTNTFGPGNPAYQESSTINTSLIACCSPSSGQYLTKDELAKVRYSFSQDTTLTLTHIGLHAAIDENAAADGIDTFRFFTPPAAYTGSVPAGSVLCCRDGFFPNAGQDNQNIGEAELRSSLAGTTILARYYVAAINHTDSLSTIGNGFSTQQQLYGQANFTNGTSQIFNGQTATITVPNLDLDEREIDNLRGESIEFDRPVGSNIYSLAYDTNHVDGYVYYAGAFPFVSVPNSSSQGFQTILARAQLAVLPKLSVVLSDYLLTYSSHYSVDGTGANFIDSVHSFDSVRAAATWQPSAGTSWRLGLGSSVAPPYLALITTPAGLPQCGNQQCSFYSTTASSGNLRPETAFGYDLGADTRLGGRFILSSDVYLTNLQNQFLTATQQNGTFTPTGGQYNGITLPLYVTQTQNLGFSRYEGIEAAVHYDPALGGFGMRIQGNLIRAFAYDLPAGIYTSAGGTPFSQNLAVIPNINFQQTGQGYNGQSSGDVPYSQGYAELNYRTRAASLFSIGATYIGPHNTYNVPAFVVVSATARVGIGSSTYLQFSADNITSQHTQLFPTYQSPGTISPILANGLLGVAATQGYGPASFRLILHHDFGPK